MLNVTSVAGRPARACRAPPPNPTAVARIGIYFHTLRDTVYPRAPRAQSALAASSTENSSSLLSTTLS